MPSGTTSAQSSIKPSWTRRLRARSEAVAVKRAETSAVFVGHRQRLADPRAGDLQVPAKTKITALLRVQRVVDAIDLDRNAGQRDVQVLELQSEIAQRFVVACHGPFALQDVDIHSRLAVGRRAEHLLLLGGDGGIAFHQGCEYAAFGLDTQRQRRDVQQ